jgi:hypothetical protein
MYFESGQAQPNDFRGSANFGPLPLRAADWPTVCAERKRFSIMGGRINRPGLRGTVPGGRPVELGRPAFLDELAPAVFGKVAFSINPSAWPVQAGLLSRAGGGPPVGSVPGVVQTWMQSNRTRVGNESLVCWG